MGERTSYDRINGGVARVRDRACAGDLRPEERRALLDALDAVPRMLAEAQELDAYDDQAVYDNRQIAKLRDRAERAERERDELRNRFGQLANDAANWPFGKDGHLWQMHEKHDFVRWLRNRAALSADADADAEPDVAWCECGHPLQPLEPNAPRCVMGCSFQAERDAEPSRAEGDERSRAINADHLERQRQWSRETFGPGPRTHGVIDHIRKELGEVGESPYDLDEWVDIIILAFDGAWRAGWEPQQIIDAVKAKQAKNEAREWPDWRTQPEDAAIEHDRSGDDYA